MKKSTFKRRLTFVVCMLMCGLSIQAADDGLITDQIIIDKLVAGTLPQRISDDEKYLITNLKINGEINGTDLGFIREMARSDYNFETETYRLANLSILDLSDAKFVSGGDYYYSNYDHYDYDLDETFYNYYFTKNNEISDYAFYGCDGLRSLTLPTNITLIGNHAFGVCRNLATLNIPSNVTSIGNCAFLDCYNLKSIDLPSRLTSIGGSAFSGCNYLASLNFPSSLSEIGESAFSGCNSLKSVTLPPNLISISNGTFSGCDSLKSVTFPSGLTSIGQNAFLECQRLSNVTFPSSPFSIGHYAFRGCRFTSLTLPSSLTEIGVEAFAHCKGLKSLTLSPSLSWIGDNAFGDCDRLTTLTIPSGLTSLSTLNGDSEYHYDLFSESDIESVYVAWEVPIPAGGFFYHVNLSNCTLYVPQGTRLRYSGTEVWRDFGEIKEYDISGVDKVDNHSEAKEASRYSLDGQRLSVPVKGLNIVRYSDGSIKKVVVN